MFHAAGPELREAGDAYLTATATGDRGGANSGDTNALWVFLAFLQGEEGVTAIPDIRPGTLDRYRTYIGEHASVLGTTWFNEPYVANAVTCADRLLAFAGAPPGARLRHADRPSPPPWRMMSALRDPARREVLRLIAEEEASSRRGRSVAEITQLLGRPELRVRTLVDGLMEAGLVHHVREEADATSSGWAPLHVAKPHVVAAFEHAVASISGHRIAAVKSELGAWVREATLGTESESSLFRALVTGEPPPMSRTSALTAAGVLIQRGLIEEVETGPRDGTRLAVPQDIVELSRSADFSPSADTVRRCEARVRAAVGPSLGQLGMTETRFAALEALCMPAPGVALRPVDIVRRLGAVEGGRAPDASVIKAFVRLGLECGALVRSPGPGRGCRIATTEVAELVRAARLATPMMRNTGLTHEPVPGPRPRREAGSITV